MGLGDELMALGEAKKLALQQNRRVCICDLEGKPRSHEYWTASPYIDPTSNLKLKNCIGNRPYIDKVVHDKIQWKEYKPIPADISHIATRQLDWGRIILEPNLKPGANQNKAWVNEYFIELIELLPEFKFVQLGKPKWVIPNIHEVIPTGNLYKLAEVVSESSMYIGVEGGLHHLSAALNLPAIVIYGGFISSRVTGYDTQYSFDAPGLGCGSITKCKHCSDLMRQITPYKVAQIAREVLNGRFILAEYNKNLRELGHTN